MDQHLRLDLDQFRLPSAPPGGVEPQKPPRHRKGEQFLKGPIPLAWLQAAARQPGAAVLVGLELWFWAGIKKSRDVSISLSHLRIAPGTSRSSAGRGLRALEQARLVLVQRDPGRKPRVTLLESVL
jgi:hypothetical protein